ncbi:MAG: BACON domain-containing protein, partial [Muribaculaceae bacterium]|nr:BACON domain-containing protein [Muribaculaceae bacterium]
MKLKHIIPALGMALLSTGFWSCSDDDVNILKRNTDEIEFTFLNSTKDLYVLTNGNWQVVPSEAWISCNPSSGTGSSTEQIVGVTVEQNDGVEREGIVVLTDGKKEIKVTIKQEDGFFYLGNVTMPESVFLNEKITNKTIEIPYYKSKPGYKANVTCELLVDGEATDEITATTIVDKDMGLGNGVLSVALNGLPTKRGLLTANLVVDINGEKTEMQGSCRVRMETEVNANVFKLLPRLVIMDWGKYAKGSGANPTMGTSNETRDYDFELAYEKYGAPIRRSVTSKANWFTSNMFYGENRFVYGNLKPETEYWFRIVQKKVGAQQNLTTDTTYVKFVTPAEPALPANTVLYDDFDRFSIKGSQIYRAFGIAVSNANVSLNFDPNNDADYLKNTGICIPPTTMDALHDVRTNTSHALYWGKCPKVWEHYWQTDKYGYDNIADLDKYEGWSCYFARQSAGGILLGGATTAGAYLGTPRLKDLGDTPTNITVVTNTCAYYEPYHTWEEDCLFHYIIVDGPGTIVDAGSTLATSDLPTSAEANTDKSVLVKVMANKEGSGKGSKYDWNVTTKHTIKIAGATKDTRIKIKNVHPCANAPHCRMAIDDILLAK